MEGLQTNVIKILHKSTVKRTLTLKSKDNYVVLVGLFMCLLTLRTAIYFL